MSERGLGIFGENKRKKEENLGTHPTNEHNGGI